MSENPENPPWVVSHLFDNPTPPEFKNQQWKTNGQVCPFCGDLLRLNILGGFSCFNTYCNPEKIMRTRLRKMKMKVVIK
jgi:hypothetical protein